MQLTLKRTLLLALLFAALLVVLVGGVIRSTAGAALPGHHGSVHSTQQMAVVCPAPPMAC
jgi:hypothetical protein